VLDLSAGIYSAGTYSSSYLKGLKCALSLLGVCGAAMTEPYTPFGEAERERVNAALNQLRPRIEA